MSKPMTGARHEQELYPHEKIVVKKLVSFQKQTYNVDPDTGCEWCRSSFVFARRSEDGGKEYVCMACGLTTIVRAKKKAIRVEKEDSSLLRKIKKYCEDCGEPYSVAEGSQSKICNTCFREHHRLGTIKRHAKTAKDREATRKKIIALFGRLQQKDIAKKVGVGTSLVCIIWKEVSDGAKYEFKK